MDLEKIATVVAEAYDAMGNTRRQLQQVAAMVAGPFGELPERSEVRKAIEASLEHEKHLATAMKDLYFAAFAAIKPNFEGLKSFDSTSTLPVPPKAKRAPKKKPASPLDGHVFKPKTGMPIACAECDFNEFSHSVQPHPDDTPADKDAEVSYRRPSHPFEPGTVASTCDRCGLAKSGHP